MQMNFSEIQPLLCLFIFCTCACGFQFTTRLLCRVLQFLVNQLRCINQAQQVSVSVHFLPFVSCCCRHDMELYSILYFQKLLAITKMLHFCFIITFFIIHMILVFLYHCYLLFDLCLLFNYLTVFAFISHFSVHCIVSICWLHCQQRILLQNSALRPHSPSLLVFNSGFNIHIFCQIFYPPSFK